MEVECVSAGPECGDLQIGARIVEGEVDGVVFLRDPLTAHPDESRDPIASMARILDLATHPAIYAGRLLAEAGHDVIRVEHPAVEISPPGQRRLESRPRRPQRGRLR